MREYDIESAEDIQDALKDLLSGTIQGMLESEMNEHLGYDKYERPEESNYRNGTKPKSVRSKYGEFEVDVPQDRQSTFEPQVVPKRKKDILILCSDGLAGLKEAVQTAFPDTEHQRCIVHIKALYLATFEATKKWTMPLRNWGKVRGELSIMFPDRLPD